MVRPSSFLRALVATVGVAAFLSVSPAPAAAGPAAEPTDPLAVTISTMSPSSLPATGNIRVTGTVTNLTDETWSRIRLYAIVGDGEEFEPMRNQGQLAEAMEAPLDEVVGYRKTEVGTPGSVDTLAPGATAGYTIVLPAEAVEVTRAGVYWFGVHALGGSPSVPDEDSFADGRARTFLPYVPRRFEATPVATSLVVPLTQPVRYAPDGSVDDVEAWTADLGPGGRLTRLLDFVDQAEAVTWLVDPALVDAVAHLAQGNRPRSLGPSRGPDEGTEQPSGEPTSEEPTEDAQPVELPDFARIASAWLDRLGETLAAGEVLTLPYGNIDVPATLTHAPELLDLALAQRSSALADLGVESAPVLTSPSGYLDAETIRAADPETRLLLTDRMFADQPPAVAVADGHRVLVTSHGAAQGGPGPEAPLTPVAIRQRLLAEAAVRVVKNDRRPLVAVLPLEWELNDASRFFGGLDVPWLEQGGLATVESAAGTPQTVSADELDYPRRQERRELDAPTVDDVRRLIDAGDTLQNLLVDNTDVGGVITEEALTGLSYSGRGAQASGRLAINGSLEWVDERLGGVRITASPGVTLSSDTGEFLVTLTNTLDHRVAVSVRAESDAGIEVDAPDEVVLPPGGRDTVLLEARTSTNSVHNVELKVTDLAGTPLGSTDGLPIRATQVSGVIWIILGTGAGLLFLAIAVRLVRRVRAARRGEPGAGRRSSPTTADPDPAAAPSVEVR